MNHEKSVGNKEKTYLFLARWFWCWPVMGVCFLAMHAIRPTLFERCEHMLFIPGLVGTVASSWTMIRSHRWRYIPQAIFSTIVLVIGAIIFWKSM